MANPNDNGARRSTPSVLYTNKHLNTITELASDVKDYGRVHDIHPQALHKHIRVVNPTVNGSMLQVVGTGLHGEDLDNQVLSVITLAEPVTNAHADGVFKIGDLFCKGFAIIGTRAEWEGDLTIHGGTKSEINLNKIKHPEDIYKYIELEPRISEIVESTSGHYFDKEMLKTFVRYICTLAEKETTSFELKENIRLRSVDATGEVVAHKNYKHYQKQELFRWICNSYDEGLTVEFDWNLRAHTKNGSNKDSKPVKKLARPTDSKSQFVIHLPDGSQGFKVYEDSKFTQRDKINWWPIAGTSVRTESESILVTFDFGEA